MFITFYSYKGGVGRTMALVNVAAELAKRGRKVLIVDFDLEANAALKQIEVKDAPVQKDKTVKEKKSEETISYEMYDMTAPAPAEMQSKAEGASRKGLPRTSYNWSTPDFNTEQYDYITENNFKNVRNNPLSTFSIDVDAASYSNIRRFINSGSLPPVDAVRIEEMVNYFHYVYPQPDGEDPFSINTEISTAPWNEKHKLVLMVRFAMLNRI